jgi:TolB-like protein/Flp pilus assembly protein TadD
MNSILPDFTYDIFISYRQKDNKGDMWVSEFVNSLKDELESTFKEEISLYFDINPHDGLLETHNVGASLKEKLRCLIFIPVISQTYCDPECFAWKYELAAFNTMAKEDRFGRDIRLSGGNVASRILPVRIHNLDPEDIALLENELGGALRSVEFIYMAPGVNRPLKPSDNPDKNLNKTYYRDQINKVANAVKEIITAMKKQSRLEVEAPEEIAKVKILSGKNLRLKIVAGSFLFIILFTIGYLYFSKPHDSFKRTEKTIAVLPFRNLSNDSSQTYFCDGFMEELLNNLQRVGEYTVRPGTSTDQYRKTSKTPKMIGNEINVSYLIRGSVGMEGDSLKIWVQLIDARNNRTIWSNNYKKEKLQLFSLQSEIAKKISGELKTILSPEEIKQIDKRPTENLEAYNYYLIGNNYSLRSYEIPNFEIASRMYIKAIELDPAFELAYLKLALCHLRLYWLYFDHTPERLAMSKEAIDAAFRIDPDLPDAHITLSSYYYMGFLNYSKALEEVDLAEKLSNNKSDYPSNKANIYRRAGDWELAKEDYYRAYELDPGSPIPVYDLAMTLFLMGEFKEAEKYFDKATLLNPTFIEVVWQNTLNYLKWDGNTERAGKTLDEAFKFAECSYNPILIQLKTYQYIYDGKYQEALAYLNSKDVDVIEHHLFYNLKSMVIANIYSLTNDLKKAYSYFDSARISLESKILKNPDDSRLYSAEGIAYAGLGLKGKAIEAGEKAIELMPINKETLRGAYRAEDLARIYVMTGEYDKAIGQIKILLAMPSRLSVKLLLLDPIWKPLWNLPEFKKLTDYSNTSNKKIT